MVEAQIVECLIPTPAILGSNPKIAKVDKFSGQFYYTETRIGHFSILTLKNQPNISPHLDFVHVYHPVTCDETLNKDQLEMCLSSKANNLLSTSDAAEAILQNKILDNL